jgi:hypothetical protein
MIDLAWPGLIWFRLGWFDSAALRLVFLMSEEKEDG